MLAQLIDRNHEMAVLDARLVGLQSGRGQLTVVLGRRQVGKTFLLLHHLERCRAAGIAAVYCGALAKASERQQLTHLASCIRSDAPDLAPLVPGDRFESWPAALEWVVAAARSRSVTLVLDEAPWFADSTPAFPGFVQQIWDRLRASTDRLGLSLVLCGSAVSAMTALVDGSGALYGRPDAELRVAPLDVRASAQLLPSLEAPRLIEAYAACGGYPLLLSAWDPTVSTKTNLRRLAGEPGGLLLRSAERLLADLPAGEGHARILHALGAGAHRRVDLQRAADQRIEVGLDVLLRAALVRRRRPVGEPDRHPPRYEIDDVYLRAWYELCGEDAGLIEGGQGDVVLERRWPRWQRHLGATFEELARRHAVELSVAGRLPEAVYGEWWTERGGQVQIDMLGRRGKRTVMAGEVKWSEHPLGLRDVEELRHRLRRAPDPVAEPTIALWSRGGVDDAVSAAGVLSFGPADMLT